MTSPGQRRPVSISFPLSFMDLTFDTLPLQAGPFGPSLAARETPPLTCSDCCWARVVTVNDQDTCRRCGRACDVVVD